MSETIEMNQSRYVTGEFLCSSVSVLNVVTVHSDGSITRGPGFKTTDEAALEFWRAVEQFFPSGHRITSLTAERDAALARVEKLEKALTTGLSRAEAVDFCEIVFRNLPEGTNYRPLVGALSDGIGWPAWGTRRARAALSQPAPAEKEG